MSTRSDVATQGRCPLCGAPTEVAFRPFCSRRCADVDLARWLGGVYAIAGGSADADEDGDGGLPLAPEVTRREAE